MFTLVILVYGFGAFVLPDTYPTREACDALGRSFATSIRGNSSTYPPTVLWVCAPRSQ